MYSNRYTFYVRSSVLVEIVDLLEPPVRSHTRLSRADLVAAIEKLEVEHGDVNLMLFYKYVLHEMNYYVGHVDDLVTYWVTGPDAVLMTFDHEHTVTHDQASLKRALAYTEKHGLDNALVRASIKAYRLALSDMENYDKPLYVP